MGMQGRWMRIKRPATIQNAYIFDAQLEQIWYGDLDLDIDRENLISLSNKMGALYILREGGLWFFEKMSTIAALKAEAYATVDKQDVMYSEQFERYVNFMKNKEKKETQKRKRGSSEP